MMNYDRSWLAQQGLNQNNDKLWWLGAWSMRVRITIMMNYDRSGLAQQGLNQNNDKL